MINVKSYGAVGDGVANDTAAFVAAIAASKMFPAQPVFIPAGRYVISQTIVTGNFRGFIGEGKT